jgi:DNA-binding transcriptional LysR family regulator
MAPDDELSERKRIRVADLEGRSFVTFRENAAVRTTVDEALASANVSVRLAFETNDLAMMRAVIARGLGVAILPETVAASSGPDLIWRPLSPSLRRTVVLIWREARRQPPASAAFIAFMERVVRDRERAAA